jgi:serine/threonine-protein kinase
VESAPFTPPSDGPVSAPAPAPAVPERDPLIGTLVAERFKILERIGEGGMGAVYVAEHEALHKRVAIKILHADMNANPEVLARFEREAQAMARLEHENVVAASDFGRLGDGTFFLAMEYVEGRSLREALAEDGRFGMLRAVKVLRQIASALSRAHALGIVHRDLKPENILLARRPGADEHVKVIDFGIARMTSGDSAKPLTQTGVVFGTPHYMAPEQALGRRVDASADQYAFGVLAFELLTGVKAFDHKNLVELLDLHVRGPIPQATQCSSELPASLDPVLARMLAKSPVERFSSVSDAMTALDQALGDTLARGATGSPIADTRPLPQSSLPTAHTVLAAVPSMMNGPATVSDAAPTVQDRAPTAPGTFGPAVNLAATRAAGPISERIAGLPVLRHPRFGAVPVVALVIVGATTLFGFASALSSVSSSLRVGRRPRANAVASERIAAFRGESDGAAAVARAAHGDTAAAIAMLRARRARQPRAADDGIVAYHLGMLLAAEGQGSEAVSAFADAVAREPQLVEDEPLVRALSRLLSDTFAASAAETLLHAGSFAGSRVAARVLAEETVFGRTADARQRAGRLARERIALMDPTARARVLLRTSERCDELQGVLAQVSSMGPGPAADDVARLRAGQCAMLRRRSLCRCVTAGRE